MRGLFLTLFIFLSACAPSPSGRVGTEITDGIIGGQTVGANDAISKSTALLLLYNRSTRAMFTCSAVLVANDLLLTAAHCFWPAVGGPRGSSFTKFVIFGASVNINSPDAFKNAYVIAENSYVLHPKYSKTSDMNDLALVRIQKPLLPGLAPAKILGSTTALKNSKQAVTVAGYGASSEAEETTAPSVYILKSLNSWMGTKMDARASSCLPVQSSRTQRPALGDSGGPAFIITLAGEMAVWGLDSHTVDLKNEYYTAITPYVSWIQQAALKLGSRETIRLSSGPIPPGKSLSK